MSCLLRRALTDDGGKASDALHAAGKHYLQAAADAANGNMAMFADDLNAGTDDLDRANDYIDAMGGFESVQ